MKLLELFAGSRSVGKAAEKLGMEVFSSDLEAFKDIHYQCNIFDFDLSRLPWQPDIVWASMPCQGFSVLTISRNWKLKDGIYLPQNSSAKLGIKIAQKTLSLIQEINPRFFFMENPMGILRKMPFMKGIKRHTVTYCQYGDTRMKPTDIWTNSTAWKPRPKCKNGDPCHEASPRGVYGGGTIGLANAYERAKIPERLCMEILKSCQVADRNRQIVSTQLPKHIGKNFTDRQTIQRRIDTVRNKFYLLTELEQQILLEQINCQFKT